MDERVFEVVYSYLVRKGLDELRLIDQGIKSSVNWVDGTNGTCLAWNKDKDVLLAIDKEDRPVKLEVYIKSPVFKEIINDYFGYNINLSSKKDIIKLLGVPQNVIKNAQKPASFQEMIFFRRDGIWVAFKLGKENSVLSLSFIKSDLVSEQLAGKTILLRGCKSIPQN